ncbi:MAG: response regulator [Nitrososphaeraceae archaeon]
MLSILRSQVVKWLYRKEDFDLILLDLAMPDFSGTDVIKSLKQGGLIDLNNIVIFTASSDRTIMDKIKDSGIKEILNDFKIN